MKNELGNGREQYCGTNGSQGLFSDITCTNKMRKQQMCQPHSPLASHIILGAYKRNCQLITGRVSRKAHVY